MNYPEFFTLNTGRMLAQLKEDSKPQFGKMSAIEMVEHLRQGVELMLEKAETKMVTPKSKIPAFQAFLMSDKEMPKDQKQPPAYKMARKVEGNLEDQKVALLRALIQMQVRFEQEPDFTALHAYFGELDKEGWKMMHYKHIKHHFKQFGIYNAEEDV